MLPRILRSYIFNPFVLVRQQVNKAVLVNNIPCLKLKMPGPTAARMFEKGIISLKEINLQCVAVREDANLLS